MLELFWFLLHCAELFSVVIWWHKSGVLLFCNLLIFLSDSVCELCDFLFFDITLFPQPLILIIHHLHTRINVSLLYTSWSSQKITLLAGSLPDVARSLTCCCSVRPLLLIVVDFVFILNCFLFDVLMLRCTRWAFVSHFVGLNSLKIGGIW